jgi:hypothetical protein
MLHTFLDRLIQSLSPPAELVVTMCKLVDRIHCSVMVHDPDSALVLSRLSLVSASCLLKPSFRGEKLQYVPRGGLHVAVLHLEEPVRLARVIRNREWCSLGLVRVPSGQFDVRQGRSEIVRRLNWFP